MAKKIRQVRINGSPYEIKDQLIDQVVTSTTIGENTTATEIKQEIETAVTGETASTNGYTIKEALAALKTKIGGSGVKNLSVVSNKVRITYTDNTTKDTDVTIGNGTLTIAKSAGSGAVTGTFTANQTGSSTITIPVPTNTSHLTNDGETGAAGEKYATETVVDTKIEDALRDITSFEYSGPYESTSDLPTTGEKGVVYLVEDPDGVSGSNEYVEYIWIEDSEISGNYEMLGKHQISIDDSNYAKLNTNTSQTFTGPNAFKGNTVVVNDGLNLAGYSIGQNLHRSVLNIGNNALIELQDNGEFDKIVSGSTTLQDALDAKQNVLTFDSTPTDGSTNPVTSDGIYDAIQAAVGTDKIHDYYYTTYTFAGTSGEVSTSTVGLPTQITTNKKLPIVAVTLSSYGNQVVPVVCTKTNSSGTLCWGSSTLVMTYQESDEVGYSSTSQKYRSLSVTVYDDSSSFYVRVARNWSKYTYDASTEKLSVVTY